MTKNEVLRWLAKNGTRRYKEGLARYGIVAPKAFGAPVGTILKFARQHGKDHELAGELWQSGWYEARMLAAMLDDPRQVTRQQMNQWAAELDNSAICDTVCWHLFAMMAGQAGHNKTASDAQFLALLPLIEKGARDERNFVKKGVNWALRRIGGRSPALHAAAIALAKRLAMSDQPSCRWVGKDALRDLSRPTVRSRLSRRRSA